MMAEAFGLGAFAIVGAYFIIAHYRDEARWKREREEGTLD